MAKDLPDGGTDTPLSCRTIFISDIHLGTRGCQAELLLDFTYINEGDWVESCTAAVEHHDGRIEIINWAALRHWSVVERAKLAA